MNKLNSILLGLLLIFAVIVVSGCDLFFGQTCEPCLIPDTGELELIVNSPALNGATAGQSYQFEFVVKNVPSDQSQVVFEWTFGTGGSGSTGSQQVSVSGRQATHQVSQTYNADGMYALVVVVKNLSGTVLIDKNIIVVVGTVSERDYDLDVCNTWRAAGSGGQGGTIDNWDISTLPVGTQFDIRFDAYSIPDKYVVTYNGVVVLDTGWRGSSSYEGDPMYPGGIAGIGSGQSDGIFTKVSGVNTFRVTVFGPGPGTAWNYDVRARCSN